MKKILKFEIVRFTKTKFFAKKTLLKEVLYEYNGIVNGRGKK